MGPHKIVRPRAGTAGEGQGDEDEENAGSPTHLCQANSNPGKKGRELDAQVSPPLPLVTPSFFKAVHSPCQSS